MSDMRTKCLSTKLTREEYAAVVARAGGQPLSEWTRDQLLAASARHATLKIILAELLALRAIVLNLHYALLAGQKLTPELMQSVIAHADEHKLRLASERLAASAGQKR
jgi:hypothetical protein